jgi:sulfur-oxidizing protein SoxY
VRARRRFFAAASPPAAAVAFPPGARAQLARTPFNNLPEVIARLVGTAPVNSGRVKLTLPPLVENGHLVPLSVSVDSPMTAADHVSAIHVFTEKNPLPEMISFYLGPRAGRAAVATQMVGSPTPRT